MTLEEMRALDAWIAEHVMGWKILPDQWFDISYGTIHGLASWYPTQSPEHALMVFKECCNKVSDCEIQVIKWSDAKPEQHPWTISGPDWGQPDNDVIQESAETFEIAVCKFAKALFEQFEQRLPQTTTPKQHEETKLP